MRDFYDKYLNNWMFKLIGVILVGLFTNALWDYFGRFTVAKIGEFFVFAMGIINSAVIDEIYRNAAKGFHEEILIEYFTIAISLLLAGLFILSKKVDMRFGNVEGKKLTEVEKKQKVERLMLVLYVLATFIIFQFTQKMIANSLLTKYRQAITICAPFLNDMDLKKIESKFGQVKNKKDYDQIYSDLKELALKNSLILPDANQ